jgi:hypothetical protein
MNKITSKNHITRPNEMKYMVQYTFDGNHRQRNWQEIVSNTSMLSTPLKHANGYDTRNLSQNPN